MGKTVGGTLGMPFEGDLSVNDISYYDPVPDGMLPNDDLDLQAVNLEILLRTGFPVCRYQLGEVWKYHISDFAPDEYGPARSNHLDLVYAPASGRFRNKFGNGMGAAIRSELWACLSPGNPVLAAQLAAEDASNDHFGDGVYAAMFLAAAESAAFTERNIVKLIYIGLANIPDGSLLHRAVEDTLIWWENTRDMLEVRKKILDKYYSQNWTDVVINIPFVVLAAVAAEGSFDKAVCGAVSLGYDADCTGATVGALFGIMDPDSIDEKWKKPIGDKLVLTPSIINMHEPRTVSEFCETVIGAAAEAAVYYRYDPCVEFSKEKIKQIKIEEPWLNEYKFISEWETDSAEALIAVQPFLMSLVYPEQIAAYPGVRNKYKLKITNTYPVHTNIDIKIAAPDGWNVNGDRCSIEIGAEKTGEVEFELIPLRTLKRCPINMLSFTLKVNGLYFTAEAGLPIAIPWTVTDENGNERIFESETPFFTVPDGRFTYKTLIKSPADKRVRITACGTRPSRLYLNGELKWEHNGAHYVPAFHRDEGWFDTELKNGVNEIRIEFENSGSGEFFLGFGTLYFCTQWDDSIEYLEPGVTEDV